MESFFWRWNKQLNFRFPPVVCSAQQFKLKMKRFIGAALKFNQVVDLISFEANQPASGFTTSSPEEKMLPSTQSLDLRECPSQTKYITFLYWLIQYVRVTLFEKTLYWVVCYVQHGIKISRGSFWATLRIIQNFGYKFQLYLQVKIVLFSSLIAKQ